MNSNKIFAAAQIVYGVARIGGAVVTGTGHGLLGAALRNHHMLATAMRLGALGFEAGKHHIEEGVAEWKAAH